LFLLTLPLAAQNDVPAHRVQKLFVLKYADTDNVYSLLRIFPDTTIVPSKDMHTLAVTTMSNVMPAIEDAINRLDVRAAAPKDIDLTVYLVMGGDGEMGPAGAVPKDLEPVVAQLKNAFFFKAYRLMDTLTLRTRTGQRADTQSAGGALQFGSTTKSVTTSFHINAANLAADGSTIRLDGMSANCEIPVEISPGQFNLRNLKMDSDLDIKEGQKVVIGRMGIDRDQAIFLVLTARVVQ